MLLFAHTGIALGAATVITGAVNSREGKTSWFASLSKYMDIRFFIIGSMLPDIIDKPVGQYIFRETFQNGRIFSHTLLFLLVLSIAGVILYGMKRHTWMLALAAGTLIHLVLDGMWGVPRTFLWPLLGWEFSAVKLEGWARGLFELIVSNPVIFLSEAVGLIILIWFGIIAIKKKQVGTLLKTGRVSSPVPGK